jgi:hypothetical protein
MSSDVLRIFDDEAHVEEEYFEEEEFQTDNEM